MPSSFISRDAMCRDQNSTREQCRTSYRLPSAQRRLLNAFPSHMVTFLCGVKERIGCTGCRRRGQRQSDVREADRHEDETEESDGDQSPLLLAANLSAGDTC